MDGFKSNPKMQCFKEGGSVKYETRKQHKEEVSSDIAQDKKIIKKAFKIHDEQEHKGEHTNLSKLRKGGRAKKDCGTVKKYKAGGSVTNVYEAKKSSGDLDNIQKTKDIKPGKAAAPSKAAIKPSFVGSDVAKEKSKPSGHKDPYIKSKQSNKAAAAPSGAKGPDKYCGGRSVRKMAVGGSTGAEQAALLNALPGKVNEIERQRMAARARNAMNYLGPAQQSQFVNQGGMNPTPAPTNVGAPAGSTIPAQKRGGKVKKAC